MEGIGRARSRGRRIIASVATRMPPPLDPGSGGTVGGRGISPGPVLRPCPAYTQTFGRGFSAETAEFQPMISCGRGITVPPTAERGMPDLSTRGRGMPDVSTRGRGMSHFSTRGRGMPHLSTHGRGMPSLRGRGLSNFSTPGRGVPTSFAPEQRPHTVGVVGPFLQANQEETNNIAQNAAKESLERELLFFENRGNGSLIHMTLNFFSQDNDVEFYMEKVLNSALRSSKMVVEFAKCLKFLTLHKTHGDHIKSTIFSKLQTTFRIMPTSLGEISNLNQMEKARLVNFCALIGQIYFRFRPFLDKPDRYNVLANPAGHCMIYLLQARGAHELSTLANLVSINHKALCQEAKPMMVQLSSEAHKALVTGVGTADHRLWILCTVDLLASGLQGNQLPHRLPQFYSHRVGSYIWERVVVESPVQLLADIPSDMTLAELDLFNVDINTYNLHKFVEL